MQSKRAFTLIELLIVVVIIGILSGVILVVLNPARFNAKARDGQRIRDIEMISQALSQSYADNNVYPGTLNTTVNPTAVTGLTSYINPVPTDPLTGNPAYCYNPSGQNYSLCACLETMSQDLNGATKCHTNATCTNSYCVRAPF